MSVKQPAPQVNARRPYNAGRRLEQSRKTHNTLLDAALTLFYDQGYTATTIESIAADAAVSEATIYKTYGGKPGIVRALCLRALGGQGPIPAEQRSDALKASEADPRKVIEGWGRLTAEVAQGCANLAPRRDAADGDPAAAALHKELDRNRLARMTENARYLVDGGNLRAGIRLSHASDVLWTFSSPELFDLLVRRRGWSLRKYSRFIVDAIANALL